MTDVVAILQNSTAVAVPMSAVADVGPKGDPGGNVGVIGLFDDADTLTIDAGAEAVRTSGHTEVGEGIADYFEDAAVDAAYVTAHPRTSFVAGSRGFRLGVPFLTASQVGVVADNVTDDWGAFNEGLRWLESKGGGLFFNDRPTKAYSSDQLDWGDVAPIAFVGPAINLQPGSGPTIRFPTGLDGAMQVRNGSSGMGAGSRIENICLEGTGVTPVSDANAKLGEGCGLRVRANSVIVRNVVTKGFEGHGTYLDSGPTDVVEFNANTCLFEKLHCYQNLKAGYASYGSNSNKATIIGLNSIGNAEEGAYENGFLGSIYISPHFSANDGWTMRFGDISRDCRVIDAYRELHATSTDLWIVDTGSGGRHDIEFSHAEGSVADPGVYTVEDNGAIASQYSINNVKVQARFGGDGSTGTMIISELLMLLTKGFTIQMQDDPLTANAFIKVLAGALRFEHGSGNYWELPSARPSITGSRTDGTALADLLTKGATLGFWADSSTP